jgi:hypothetical protein
MKSNPDIVLEAAECAESVLHIFESICPEDHRPREAINAARCWARGEISVAVARKAAFAAHAAARETPNPAAKAAARAAGHAAATVHVASHSTHAKAYADKAIIEHAKI